MRLDIQDLEDRPSDKVSGIADKLESLIPTIHDHRRSVGTPGGFLERVRAGTWAGHMVEHVVLELQNMIGLSVGYGKIVDSYDKGTLLFTSPNQPFDDSIRCGFRDGGFDGGAAGFV